MEENRHFLLTLLALGALSLSSSGQKASIAPSVLGVALGATPQGKEEPLHQETVHRGQPFHALAPLYPAVVAKLISCGQRLVEELRKPHSIVARYAILVVNFHDCTFTSS